MYTQPGRQRDADMHDIEVIETTLFVAGEAIFAYETRSDALIAGNRYARLLTVGCRPIVTSGGEVITEHATTEQRKALREKRVVHK